jgi:hypothetical protein
MVAVAADENSAVRLASGEMAQPESVATNIERTIVLKRQECLALRWLAVKVNLFNSSVVAGKMRSERILANCK